MICSLNLGSNFRITYNLTFVGDFEIFPPIRDFCSFLTSFSEFPKDAVNGFRGLSPESISMCFTGVPNLVRDNSRLHKISEKVNKSTCSYIFFETGQLFSLTTVKENMRRSWERPKSAPYLRLKNGKKDFKVSSILFYSTRETI